MPELPHMTGKGVAPVRIPAIDKLVEIYVRKRDARMEQLRIEVEAKEDLIAALHEFSEQIGKNKEGEIIYRHDDLLVTLTTGKEKLKVRTEGAEEPE